MAVQISFCGYNGNTTVHTIGNCGRIGQKYEFIPFNIKKQTQDCIQQS